MKLDIVSQMLLLSILLLLSHSPIIIIAQIEINKEQYLEVMKNLNQIETKSKLRYLLGREYNYSELLDWEHQRLNYTNESINRYEDPIEILNYGKGRCQEFSILYVALCLANGYQSRFVIDIYGDHTWAEIRLHDAWTHIDPTERRINDPYMYERDWHKDIVLILAFEDDLCQDVTANYRRENLTDFAAVVV